ncbi:MAG: Zn-dependent hydrolase [Vicinamibacterales bacterium]
MTTTTLNLRVNEDRLRQHMDELALVGGRPDGGVCRLAFSEADRAGRDFVEARMRALGLDVRIDRIGNIVGIRAGREKGPVVLAGSHTDTVATGGRFDGSAGVSAALEAVEAMNDAAVTTALPVGVVSFVNEEGARFVPDMMGSLVLRGDLSVEDARKSVDADGVSVGEAMDRVGYAGQDDLSGLDIRCYLEMHIEQGPVLEREGVPVGVVESVQGIKWLAVTLHGATAHAGATPMSMRRDAALVAAEIVQFARRLAADIETQRATVGSLTLSPNIVNVVADEARLIVDLRNPDRTRLENAEARLRSFIAVAARREGVEHEIVTLADVPPARFDEGVVAAIEESAAVLGYRSRRMMSGAGHDAQIISARWPAAMIFVPSRGGVSHNVQEYTSPSELAAGANVLLHAMLRLAG